MKEQEKHETNFENVQIPHHSHLGDTLIALNCLYNRCKATSRKILIRGPVYIEELFDIFDFDGLFYCGEIKQVNLKPWTVFNILPIDNLSKQNLHWFLYYQIIYSDNFEKNYPKVWHYPKIKIIPKKSSFDKTFFQFDSRNWYDNKFDVNKLEKFIYTFKKNIYGIGGPDTKKYADRPFNIGNLKTIASMLLGAKEFVGSDSGISHLACLLQVKTTVINRSLLYGLEQMYKCLYPKTNLKIIHFLELDALLSQKCKILI